MQITAPKQRKLSFVYQTEGILVLWTGVTLTATRGLLITAGQVC